MNDGAATSSGKTSRRAPRFLAWRATVGLTIALLVCPLFVDLAVSGVRGGFRYVAADSFYYLTVARNVAQSGRFSFDQQTVTNGFHPLWQLVLVLVYGAGHAAGVTDSALLVAVVVVNAISLAGAVYFIGLAVKDEDRLPPVFVLVPVGTLGLLLAPMWLVLGPARVAKESIAEGGRPLYGTLWSYANGMESALLLLLFGATAAMFVRGYWARGRRHAVAFGLLLGALVLARLDHVWLSVLVAAWLLIASWKKSDNARACSLATCETLAVVIVAYLVVNRVAFGSAVPVSGKLKTSFPHFATDNIATLGLMLRGEWPGLGLAVRSCQTMIPFLGAVIYLAASALRRRRPAEPMDVFLRISAVAVLAIAAYNFLFVPPGHQGHWYYPMSSLWLSAVVVRGLGHRFWRSPLSMRNWAAWALPCSALTGAVFVTLFRDPDYHRDFARFQLEEAPKIHSHYQNQRPRIMDYDDGIIGYALGYPAISGLGFVLDQEAVEYFRANRLLDLAVARGFDLITSVQYLQAEGSTAEVGSSVKSSPFLATWLVRRFGRDALRRYDFVVDYRSQTGRFLILRALPLPP